MLSLAAWALAVALPAVAAGPGAPPPNIVIFAPDGLRADRLGAYGYRTHPTSPAIDAAAREALVFEAAEAQSSWTLPSFASLFTSRYPTQHGALWVNARLASSELTLAEILSMRGYRTGAFVGGPFLNPEYGFDQGFDRYNAAGSRHFSDTLPPALEWMKENKGRPFFAFIHGNDVHPPFNPALPDSVRDRFDPGYEGPARSLVLDYYFVRVFNRYPWTDGPPPDDAYKAKVDAVRADARSLEHINALYDAQVARVDEAFARLRAFLEKEGLAAGTVVVLLSDHGLELGEKGRLGTGYHAVSYETITRVPLLFWGRGVTPGRRADVAQLVDVAPTLLALSDTPAPDGYQGRSLLEAPASGRAPAALGEVTVLGAKDVREYFVREGDWKLIYRPGAEPRRELYRLSTDPGERDDRAGRDEGRAKRLAARLSALTTD